MNPLAQARLFGEPIGEFGDPSQLERPGRIVPDIRPRTVPVDVSAARPLRLSAVVATYQGERYLLEQLRSMLEQTIGLDEIVIVDDCSTDSTLAIAEDVKSNSAIPIRILPCDSNVGIRRNFERGLLATSGDIVFLADQDDAWRSDKVARVLEEFNMRPGLNLLFTNARLIDQAGNPLHDTLFRALRIAGSERRRVRSGQAFEALLRRNLATGTTMAIRRSALLGSLPIPEGWLHDEWIAMATAACGQIDFLDLPLTDYRQHDGNQIGAPRATLLSTLDKLKRCRREFNCHLARRTELQIERLSEMDPPIPEQRALALQAKLERSFMAFGGALP
jgi:hypothetical protein